MKPSPIVRRMIEELRGDVRSVSDNTGTPIIETVKGECQCPTCGAHLTVDIQS